MNDPYLFKPLALLFNDFRKSATKILLGSVPNVGDHKDLEERRDNFHTFSNTIPEPVRSTFEKTNRKNDDSDS